MKKISKTVRKKRGGNISQIGKTTVIHNANFVGTLWEDTNFSQRRVSINNRVLKFRFGKIQ